MPTIPSTNCTYEELGHTSEMGVRLEEEAPLAYKQVEEVIRVVEGANIARVVARLEPIAVIKG
jgi:RNA-splicing ligase RtcB